MTAPDTVDPRARAEARERARGSQPIASVRRDTPRTRSATLADALARPCPEHRADPGAYCYEFGSGVRGLCSARYGVAVAEGIVERGVSLWREFDPRLVSGPGAPVAVPPTSTSTGPHLGRVGRPRAADPERSPSGAPEAVRPDPRAKLDRQHKNRHPVREVRA